MSKRQEYDEELDFQRTHLLTAVESARRHFNYSHTDMAAKLGMSRRTWTRWRTNKDSIPAKVIADVSKKLNLLFPDPDQLIANHRRNIIEDTSEYEAAIEQGHNRKAVHMFRQFGLDLYDGLVNDGLLIDFQLSNGLSSSADQINMLITIEHIQHRLELLPMAKILFRLHKNVNGTFTVVADGVYGPAILTNFLFYFNRIRENLRKNRIKIMADTEDFLHHSREVPDNYE